MSKTKTKPAKIKIEPLRSVESFRESVQTVARLNSEESSAAGAAAAIHAEALEGVSAQVAALQSEAKRCAELKQLHLEAAAKYGLANASRIFGEGQSTTIGTAECGFRASPNRIAVRDDVDPVLLLQASKAGKKYVRSKPTLDKQKLLSDYRDGVIGDDELNEVGLAVKQDTIFFVRLGTQVLETVQ